MLAVTKLRMGAVILIAAVAFTGGCGTVDPPPSNTEPTQGSDPNPFAQIDKASQGLIAKEATWQAPASLTVGSTERIGLSIGEGRRIKDQIDRLLPSASPVTAGVVAVGPTVRATLFATAQDADISPSDAIDASTGSDVQMLWTWLVHPKRPTDRLTLTAHLEVPLSDGHVVTHELSLTLPVKRTTMYTLTEVATHWGTWSGVGASIIGIVGWFLARRRKKRETPVTV